MRDPGADAANRSQVDAGKVELGPGAGPSTGRPEGPSPRTAKGPGGGRGAPAGVPRAIRRWPKGGRRTNRPAPPPGRSSAPRSAVLPGDLRAGREDGALAVGRQEEAVGDLDG